MDARPFGPNRVKLLLSTPVTGSLNVALTGVPSRTSPAPPAGDVAVTVGGRVSEAAAVVKVQLVGASGLPLASTTPSVRDAV